MCSFIFFYQVSEGSMAYKMSAQVAPPSNAKPPTPEGVQKEATPTTTVNQDKLGKKDPVGQVDEFGYIVTNQRYASWVSGQSGRLKVWVDRQLVMCCFHVCGERSPHAAH